LDDHKWLEGTLLSELQFTHQGFPVLGKTETLQETVYNNGTEKAKEQMNIQVSEDSDIEHSTSR